MKSGIDTCPLQSGMQQREYSDHSGTYMMKKYGVSFSIKRRYLKRIFNDNMSRSIS
jgi:hypothetical protein